jgi:prepilin-type N-terminal cleavage/methylation domain-containing protein
MHKRHQGFTIVELLIVIVVVGVLATIVIVGYNGVRSRSLDVSLKADSEQAAKILENDNTLNGAYPATGALANSGKGLPRSNGNTYSYTPNNTTNPPAYSLTYSNSGYSSGSYVVTSTNPIPTLVTGAAPIITTPLAPVVANTDGCGGDYYNFYMNASATGSPTPTVQWQTMTPVNTTSGTWGNIPGATTNFYIYPDSYGNINPDEYRMFRAIFTSGSYNSISPTFQLTLTNGC